MGFITKVYFTDKNRKKGELRWRALKNISGFDSTVEPFLDQILLQYTQSKKLYKKTLLVAT